MPLLILQICNTFHALPPCSSLFQADKSHIFQVQFRSSSELPSLSCRLPVLAATRISGASGTSAELSSSLSSPFLPSLLGDLTKPWDHLLSLFLALHKLSLCATALWGTPKPAGFVPSCPQARHHWHPGLSGGVGDAQQNTLFHKDEHLGQTNSFSKVGNKFG